MGLFRIYIHTNTKIMTPNYYLRFVTFSNVVSDYVPVSGVPFKNIFALKAIEGEKRSVAVLPLNVFLSSLQEHNFKLSVIPNLELYTNNNNIQFVIIEE